jgi:hypothetical protein
MTMHPRANEIARTRWLALSALVIATATSLGARAQRENKLVGVWEMDVAKSEWDPAFPVPYRAFNVRITSLDSGYRLESDVVLSDGRQSHAVRLWRYDGGETPWGPPGETVQFHRINDSTYQFELRASGSIRFISRGTLAADGRSRRHVVVGFNAANGQPYRNVEVYRRK